MAPIEVLDWEPSSGKELRRSKALCDSLYTALWGFRQDLTVSSYRSKTDVQAHDIERAMVRKEGMRFRSEIGGVVTIQDEYIRIMVDKQAKVVMMADPFKFKDMFMEAFAIEATESFGTCAARPKDGGVEYRFTFNKGAVYEHIVAWYDAKGWLRRTETVWHAGVSEAPLLPMAVVTQPRLVTEYGMPSVIKKGEFTTATDPWTILEKGTEGPKVRSEWATYELIDTRLRQ
jgi:hypothetical protein